MSYPNDLQEPIEKGLFGYPAGKRVMSKKLVTMIPPHRVYVEPFVGSGAVLFAKEKSEVEVVNDYDPEVAALWKALSGMTPDQIGRLSRSDWQPTQQTFARLKASKPSGSVAVAHRFLYLARYSHNSSRASFATYGRGTAERMPGLVTKHITRIQNIRAHHGDYEIVCKKHDSSDTFFFLDPPYAGHAGGVGESSFDEERFFRFLKSLKGKWLLTYGVRGKLPGMLRGSGFTVKSWDIARAFDNATQKEGEKTLGQIIAYNYTPSTAAKKAAGEDNDNTTNSHQGGGQLEKASYRTMKLPDPKHVVSRLSAGHESGLLSSDPRAELVGQGFVLTDGSKAHGVVRVDQGRAIPSGPKAVETLGAKIDKATAADFRSVSEQVWYYPMQLVEQWDPPRGLSQSGPVTKELTAAQQAELKLEDAKIAANKQKPLAKQQHKFVAAKYTHKNGHPRCIICGDEESISGFCNAPEKDNAAAGPETLGKCRYCDDDADGVVGWKKGGAAVPVCKAHTPDGLKPRSGMVIHEIEKEEPDPDELQTVPTRDLLELLHVLDAPSIVAKSDDACNATQSIIDELIRRDDINKAVWSTAYKNRLPDSHFMYIAPGGKKDEEGKTVPRTLRNFPIKDENGKIDLIHVRNAIGRIPQSNAPGLDDAMKAKLQEKAREILARERRVVKALVIQKIIENAGDGGIYECAIGPLPADESGDWGMVVEYDGERYTKIGKVAGKQVEAEVGDTLLVDASELLLDSHSPKTLHWFQPIVVAKTDERPLTTHSAESLVRDDEIKKLDGRAYQPLPLIKSDSLRYVLGIVLEPNDGQDGAPLDPDSQRDVYSSEEIRQAQWRFWQYLRLGEIHQRQIDKGKIEIVDCFIAPADFSVGGQLIRKGTWMLGAHILDDELWQKVERGEYNAWSVDGSAVRIPEKRQAA